MKKGLKKKIKKKPLKLIIATQSLRGLGGLQLVILKLAQKYNAKIYTFNYEPETTFPEFRKCNIVNLGNLKVNRFFVPRIGLKFLNMKIKEDYDVLNVEQYPSQWLANKNPRILWYCHSPHRGIYMAGRAKSLFFRLMSFFYKKINKRIAQKTDKIIVNSKNIKNRVKKFLDVKSEVVYPGVDLKDFKSTAYKKYFFYPSRIAKSKRLEYAIEAYNIFKKKHPDFELIIAGSLSKLEKPYFKKLRKLHKGKILLNIPQKQMKELYANCYGVLFSARNEDFGLIPLEAMASYKPIISVNEGGPIETVIDGKTGYLVNSPGEMAQKMGYLAKNPAVVKKMGKAGREHVRKNFTWDIFFKRFDKACREVAKLKAK